MAPLMAHRACGLGWADGSDSIPRGGRRWTAVSKTAPSARPLSSLSHISPAPASSRSALQNLGRFSKLPRGEVEETEAASYPPSCSYDFVTSTSTVGRALSRREMNLHQLLTLGTDVAMKEFTIRQFLDAAVEGDIPRSKRWAGRLQGFGEGVEAAAAAIADPANKRYGCLHLAAAIGEANMCQTLITSYHLDANSTDANGATPLIFAIKGTCSIAVMELLLDLGADPNKADIDRTTPLHVAVEQDAIEAANLLLSKGVSVDPLSEKGETPLHISAKNGNSGMLKLLLLHHASFEKPACTLYTPLSVAVFGSSLECLKLLIKAGADVNAGKPVTPLVVAAAKGLSDCTKCLLGAGADANIPDELGKIPVEIAAVEGCLECVAILFPATTPLATYAKWSIHDIVQQGKSERLHKGSRLRALGDASFQERNYASTSHTYKLFEPSMGDVQKEEHDKLMSHCHSMITSISALILPVMIAMFAVETPLRDGDKAMLLVIFVAIGALAIIGLTISTSLAERHWAPIASALTLCLQLFSLGIYQLAVGLFFPKFEGKQIMSLDIHFIYIWCNIAFFLVMARIMVWLWRTTFSSCFLSNRTRRSS